MAELNIHKAQKNGKTNQKCECDCHITYSSGSNTFGQVCTCQGIATTGYCPIHGNTFIFGNQLG